MFRVRRSTLPLLASAVGATLPAWSFAQNSATWTYNAGTGGPWAATWTDLTSNVKPWSPNNTYPNSSTANPLFASAYLTGTNTINGVVDKGLGTVTLNLSVLTNSLNFYGQGTNTLSAPGNVLNLGYQITGTGSITFIPSLGTGVGTVDVSSIGKDPNGGGVGTPTTLPGMATLSVSINQATGSFFKTGLGTLVLDASNNFSGTTGIQVNDGVLRITKSDAIAGASEMTTVQTGAIELYNNANSVTSQGTSGQLFTFLGSTNPSANGELAAMGGSNSTWGDANSIMTITGSPSLGAGTGSKLTIPGSMLFFGTNGLTKVGAGTVVTNGIDFKTLAGGGALNINAGVHKIAALAGNSNANTSYVYGLTIAGGGTPTAQLDLTSNDMVVDYTGSTSPFATIRAQIIAGRNGGSWNGNGIISSSIPTSGGVGNDPSERGLTTALGYAENADLGRATLGGFNVPSTSVLIKYTWPGDANLDGSVDGNDIGIWATHFTGTLGPGGTSRWQDGDWNYDGSIDGNDIALWATHFTGTLGAAGLGPVDVPEGTSTQAIGLMQSYGIDVVVVPEPTVLGGVGLGLVGLLSRRKRKS